MEFDIANNIKAVELLKVEMLQNITDLFGDIAAEADEETGKRIAQDGARLICQTYLLCSRLGVEFSDIDDYMKQLLAEGIKEEHLIERRFGDLKKLLHGLETRRCKYEKE